MAESNEAIVPDTGNNAQDGEASGVMNIKEQMRRAVKDDTVEDTCSLIIQEGVNKRYENNKTALMVAIEIGCEQVVDALIEAEADLDAEEEKGQTPLMFAALNDHENFTKVLIEKGADVNRTDEFGQTALHFAAEGGHIDIVHLLIKSSAKVDAQHENGDTSLMRAAKFGHLDVVNALLDAGASVNAQNQEGMTSLMNAAQNGYDNIVKVLTAAGGDVSKKSSVGNTALNYAAEDDKIDVVKVLTKVRPEVGDQNGSISLMAAIEKDHMVMVKTLIEGGIDLNKRFTSEDAVLHFAAGTDNPDVANMLINAGAALDALNEDKNTPLMIALKKGYYNTANRLIDKGADVKNTNIRGETTLHCAARTGHVNTVQSLIEADVELDAQDKEGLTPLMIALQNDCSNTTKGEDEREKDEHDEKDNYKEVANLLIEKGADINKKNMEGETAFHFAASTDHPDIMKKLIDALKKKQVGWNKKNKTDATNKQLEAAAEMDTQNKNGWTPLMIAVKYGHDGIAEVLMNEGVDLNRKNKFGETALYHAADSGNVDATEKLLGAAAKADTQNKDGWTPLMISLKNGHFDISNLLMDVLPKRDFKKENKFGETALHFAVEAGDINIVRKLMKNGAKANIQNRDGWTPLMIALKNRHVNIANDLICERTQLAVKNKFGETALHFAVEAGDKDVLTKLTEAGDKGDNLSQDGKTPLMISIEKGLQTISQTLIDNKVGVKKENMLRETALHFAAKSDQSNVIEKLIDAGVDINKPNNSGSTALHVAANSGSVEVVNKLIQNGAKINIRDQEGCTPLMIASKSGNKSIVEVLVNNITSDDENYEYSINASLYLAAECGHIEIIRELPCACDFDFKHENGLTPLMIASKKGHDNIVNFFIQNEANVNEKDNYGKTALHLAAEAGHLGVANILMNTGAETNIPDEEGLTPLLTAANSTASNAEEIIRALLVKAKAKNIAKKALVNKTSKDGTTALMFSAYNGQQKIVETLLEAGAEVNAQRERDGETALTLVQEELILIRLAQSSIQKDAVQFLKENTVREKLRAKQLAAEPQARHLVDVIEEACSGETFSEYEKDQMRKKFEEIPVYKAIREKLLKAGGYHVTNVENPETKMKIKHILRWTEVKVLRDILKGAKEGDNYSAVSSMFKLLASDEDFVTWWTPLFNSLPNKKSFLTGPFLQAFAEAGNVEVLGKLIVNVLKADHKPRPDNNKTIEEFKKENDLGNTFLHTYAQKHSLRKLFQEISKDKERHFRTEKTIEDWFKHRNKKGYTFLAVAVNSENKQRQEDIIEALDRMAVMFGEPVVSNLCKKTDNGGNNLLHLAVRKSLMELISFILSKTPDAQEILNQDGYSPLHLAIQMNSIDMVRNISQQEHFNADVHMRNGETVLHIAAQLGYYEIFEEVIEKGGDLSLKDKEDGHTPLHDCLQQVYFESRSQDEKCEKFIEIWDKIVEKAVRWWCIRTGAEEPAHGSTEHLNLLRKAVYYLRSCVENNDGLSVLQFAADRGLVTCVHTMLSTKGVFVIQTKTSYSYEMDVTNLCPEYFVEKDVLYTETERKILEKTQKMSTITKEHEEVRQKQNKPKNKRRHNGTVSFLEALAEVRPPNKAGEILESIPMKTLTQLEWTITRWIHLFWMVIHIALMTWATVEITASIKDSTRWSGRSTGAGLIVLMYATIITCAHIMIKIGRRLSIREKAMRSVKKSIDKYEKDDKGILDNISSVPLFLLRQSVFFLEILFAGFAWAILILKITNFDMTNHVWIKGFFLLFGWLILLFPLTSFSTIYKLISVLKYIILDDMLPWIVIYITISIGFAAAIRLQFEDLPVASSCEDLAGFLNRTGHAFFELVIMTSGLDTDIKHARSLSCMFENDASSIPVILILITMYAVFSAVVLLNMLIAIMSNTVTEAQQDKGWRQYQINQTLWVRETAIVGSAFCSWFKNVIYSIRCYCPCNIIMHPNPRECSKCSPRQCSKKYKKDRRQNPKQKIEMQRLIPSNAKAIYDGRRWYVKLDSDIFLDGWIRGERMDTWNKHNIRYDKSSHRWYLKLSALSVKEIRAKVWQHETE